MSQKIIESKQEIRDFIAESKRIEGIHKEPTGEEVNEYRRFMMLDTVMVEDLEQFVSIYERGHHIRDRIGDDVVVGGYHPPRGTPEMKANVERLLKLLPELNAYDFHVLYEQLHPFTDCNGRSGRMLWKWKMRRAPLGFLHTFYYQTLQAEQERKAAVKDNALKEIQQLGQELKNDEE